MASDVQELELEYYVLSQFYLLTCGGNLSHVFPRFQLAHMYKNGSTNVFSIQLTA